MVIKHFINKLIKDERDGGRMKSVETDEFIQFDKYEVIFNTDCDDMDISGIIIEDKEYVLFSNYRLSDVPPNHIIIYELKNYEEYAKLVSNFSSVHPFLNRFNSYINRTRNIEYLMNTVE